MYVTDTKANGVQQLVPHVMLTRGSVMAGADWEGGVKGDQRAPANSLLGHNNWAAFYSSGGSTLDS